MIICLCFRQSAILERETGLEISRVTLCGWVMAVGELLMPIVGAMRQELLSGGYIQADEPRSMSNPNEPKARIIRPICGNIAGLAKRSYLISSWIVVHSVLGSSWATLMASCRRTARRLWQSRGQKYGACRLLGTLSGERFYLE